MQFFKNKIFLVTLLFIYIPGLVVADATLDSSDSGVEKLLNSLAKASSQKEAILLKEKIWQFWLIDHENNSAVEQFDVALDYFERNKLEKANQLFSEIISSYPDYMEAWNKRATIRFLKGDYQGSLADIEEVLLRQKRHFGAISGAGLIYLALGDYQRALRSYKRVLEIDPLNKEALYFVLNLRDKLYGKIL